jgi:OFA family oxalate/formate antiporter-like MFS transporter
LRPDADRSGERIAGAADDSGRARVYFLLYAIQAVIFFVLPSLTTVTTFTAPFALIGLGYGGGFGTMPSFTADFFGARYLSGIYGWILLGGVAAIPSPLLIARLRQTTGGYDEAISAVAIVMLVAATLPLLVRRPSPPRLVALEPEPVAVAIRRPHEMAIAQRRRSREAL